MSNICKKFERLLRFRNRGLCLNGMLKMRATPDLFTRNTRFIRQLSCRYFLVIKWRSLKAKINPAAVHCTQTDSRMSLDMDRTLGFDCKSLGTDNLHNFTTTQVIFAQL